MYRIRFYRINNKHKIALKFLKSKIFIYDDSILYDSILEETNLIPFLYTTKKKKIIKENINVNNRIK